MKRFSNWLSRIFKTNPDPIYNCELYKDKGCAHVDGFLCDVRTCRESIDYNMRGQIYFMGEPVAFIERNDMQALVDGMPVGEYVRAWSAKNPPSRAVIPLYKGVPFHPNVYSESA